MSDCVCEADVTLSELVPSVIVVASQYFATEISAGQAIECTQGMGADMPPEHSLELNSLAKICGELSTYRLHLYSEV